MLQSLTIERLPRLKRKKNPVPIAKNARGFVDGAVVLLSASFFFFGFVLSLGCLLSLRCSPLLSALPHAVRRSSSPRNYTGTDGLLLTRALNRASSSAPDAATVVRNLLASLDQQGMGSAAGAGAAAAGAAAAGQAPREKVYPLLNDLLETAVTVPMVRQASEEYIDGLLSYLPPTVLILSQQEAGEEEAGDLVEPTTEAAAAAKAAMSLAEKKSLLEKVLRSPQFSQSLASLSMALRDGGLPSIADALAIPVKNQGFLAGGAMPMGGGEAVEAFVEGVKSAVVERLQKQNP